jgi:hypothetical protein
MCFLYKQQLFGQYLQLLAMDRRNEKCLSSKKLEIYRFGSVVVSIQSRSKGTGVKGAECGVFILRLKA